MTVTPYSHTFTHCWKRFIAGLEEALLWRRNLFKFPHLLGGGGRGVNWRPAYLCPTPTTPTTDIMELFQF